MFWQGPWTSQSTPLWILMHTTTPSLKNYQWGYEISCLIHTHDGYGLHGATHIWMHDSLRLGHLSSTPLQMRKPMLFAFDTCFPRNLAKVYDNPHVLKCMNIFYAQMAKAVVPKLKHAISYCILLQVGRIRFVHIYKIYFIEVVFIWHYRNGFTVARFQIFFVYLNWTFNLCDTSLLTINKLACDMGTWSTCLIQIWLILPLTIVSMMIDPIPMALTTLLSPECTLRRAITLYEL